MMRKFYLLLATYCLLLALPAFADYVPGEILVKFKPGVVGMSVSTFSAAPKAASIKVASVKALVEKLGVTRVERIFAQTLKSRPNQMALVDYYKIVLPANVKMESAIKELKKNPNVIIAQPNYIYRAFKTTPNDPLFLSGAQWGLQKINAESGWDYTTGESTVAVAVVDTGVDYRHADLSGKVDLTNGYDFVNKDADPLDDHGHGTEVAGVIAASTNNGVGVAGVDWGARVMPLKSLKPEPDGGAGGDTIDVIDAIDWARTHGAQIINMSLGQTTADGLLEEAIKRAYSAGLVLVAAAGNDGLEQRNYPGAYEEVICVAATGSTDARSEWPWATKKDAASNYGSWVDVSAPGTHIATTQLGGGYDVESGTSLACPFVAGLAALIKAAYPAFTNAQIFRRITAEASVDNINAQNPNYIGKLGTGRINLYKSLAGLTARITSPLGGEYIRGEKDIYGSASGRNFISYTLEATGSNSLVTIETGVVSVEGGKLGTWNTAGLGGEYALRLRVLGGEETTSEANVSVMVDNVTPEASITAPASGATVEGGVMVLGKAKDQYFDHYVLEYGRGVSPSEFQVMVTGLTEKDSGVLGTWETAGLSGAYVLRLTVFDKAGASASSLVLVNIAEAAPTKEAEDQPGLPKTFALPNPFILSNTSEAALVYTLQGNFNTVIYLFDVNGNLIWQKSYLAGENGGKAGPNAPGWNGFNLFGEKVPNGVYCYQVAADRRVIARGKIIVIN